MAKHIKKTLLYESDINLDEIMQLIKHYIETEFPLKWENKLVLPNNVELREDLEHSFTYAFDFNNFNKKTKKLNKIRLFFIGSLEKNKITSFFENRDILGYYINDFSNISKNYKENFGCLFFNFSYFLNAYMTRNNYLIFEEIENAIFHEIRHYYDNIIGIYDPTTSYSKIVDLERWCFNCFNYSENTNITDKNIDTIIIDDNIYEINKLLQFIYVMSPTELNAYSCSLGNSIKNYIMHTGIKDKKSILHYIEKNFMDKTEYYVYNLHKIFKNKQLYIKYINNILKDDLDNYFYFFINVKKILRMSKKQCEIINNYFNKFFIDLKDTTLDIIDIEERLPIAFIKFIQEYYISATYESLRRLYNKSYIDMNAYIDFYINK